jgi:hypothetical protein
MPTFHLITHKGVTDSIAGWAKKVGIPHVVIYARLVKLGWTTERALTTPAQRRISKGKRIRRTIPRLRKDNLTLMSATTNTTLTEMAMPFAQLKVQELAIQRQFNSILRQFNRDLHTIMSRSLDRGVGLDQPKSAKDRSTPVTQDSV